MLNAERAMSPNTKVAKDCGDWIIVATAIFCSALVAFALTRMGPEIFPAALISPRILYTLGMITAGLILNHFMIGTNRRINPSVNPRRSKIRPTITLTIMAIPTSLVRKISTTIGFTSLIIESNKADSELGANKRRINDPKTNKIPITSKSCHFDLVDFEIDTCSFSIEKPPDIFITICLGGKSVFVRGTIIYKLFLVRGFLLIDETDNL